MSPLSKKDDLLSSWRELSSAALTGARASSQAMLTPLRASAAFSQSLASNGNGHLESTVPSITFENEGWDFERTVDHVEDITVGDSVRFTKSITDDDMDAFAIASGDTNRVHLDEAYAERTRFGTRIVHGTLISGLISAALARLPGLTIYLSQEVEFLRPVLPNSVVTAYVEVVEDLGDGKYRLLTSVENEDGEAVIDGEAVVLIDTV